MSRGTGPREFFVERRRRPTDEEDAAAPFLEAVDGALEGHAAPVGSLAALVPQRRGRLDHGRARHLKEIPCT